MKFLQSLYEYAKAHGLEREAFFEENEVEWLLEIHEDGRVSLRRLEGPRKGRGVPMHLPIPLKRSANILPNLVDNGMYVLGMKFKDDPGRRKRSDAQWHLKCHEAYVQLVERVAAETQDPHVTLVARVLRERLENLASDPAVRDAGVQTSDTICPATLEEGRWVPLATRPSVREWWIAHYGELQKIEAGRGVCQVTGREGPLARVHPLVRGIPGGPGTGVTLLSFNDASSESWGKKQGANAPVSVEAAILCSKALSRIASRASGKRRAVMIDEGLYMAFLTRREPDEEAADFVLSLLDPREDDFHLEPDGLFAEREIYVWRSYQALFGAARIGSPPIPPATPVDVLVFRLRPASGRVEVLRYEERTFFDVNLRLGEHFRDLSIYDSWTGTVRGDFPLRNVWTDEKGKPPLRRGLLDVLVNPSNKKGASPETASRLFLTAVFGGPYPKELLQLALAAGIRYVREGKAIPLECAALLKACVNRSLPKSADFKGVQPMLDPECRVVPYVLGRLLAVAERVQEIAIPGVVASVTKRLYDMASKQPGRVMPAVLRGLNHHMAKIARAKPGLAVWCQKLVSQVTDLLPSDPEKAFPCALTLPEQGVFQLGYFHQRTSLFSKREEEDEEDEKAEKVETEKA